jgi:thioredoxin reductase (NADPH)
MASDNAQSHPRVVRLFGNRDSAEAWAIRDFLKRSVVEFEWTELSGDEECRNAT